MKRILFLNPPSFEGFDGGAGSRYQARREITSYWYPTWLAQAAALVPGSKLIDAPPHHSSMTDILEKAKDYDIIIIHTSTPSLFNDIQVATTLKNRNPEVQVGMVGPHVTVLPEETLGLSNSIDFVCRGEFDHTCLELAEGKPYEEIRGLCYRDPTGSIVRCPDREPLENLDSLPSVLPVYHRDLVIENYFIGYLLHPYVSFYTGRGCPARCTFCLWPQTITGHRYRTKSPQLVIREVEEGKDLFPQVEEWFFDDDTFTADRSRAIEIAKGMKRLGLIWSCNARANVDRETLRELKKNNLRLLVVGFESGNETILKRVKKGVTLSQAREFMKNCRELGIKVHGTFILGLPIETRQSIEETIRFAQELDPYTIQVSLAAPYPGTELYEEAVRNGWLKSQLMVDGKGLQTAVLSYPHLSPEEMEEAVERMYKKFYFRIRPLMRMIQEMARERTILLRRIREGREFLCYLSERKRCTAK